MKNSLCHRFKVKTFAAAALLAAFGMQSCQDENLVGQPTWLNNSILSSTYKCNFLGADNKQ